MMNMVLVMKKYKLIILQIMIVYLNWRTMKVRRMNLKIKKWETKKWKIKKWRMKMQTSTKYQYLMTNCPKDMMMNLDKMMTTPVVTSQVMMVWRGQRRKDKECNTKFQVT